MARDMALMRSQKPDNALLNSWLKYPDYRKADNDNLRSGRYAGLASMALANLTGVR